MPTEQEQDAAAAKVVEMFSQALEALAVLYRVAPEHAKALTRELMDNFDNLRSLQIGS
jgi:hypothetical protein